MLTRAFNQWLPHRHQAGFSTSLFTLAGCVVVVVVVVVVIVQYIHLCVCFICSAAVRLFEFCSTVENNDIQQQQQGNNVHTLTDECT